MVGTQDPVVKSHNRPTSALVWSLVSAPTRVGAPPAMMGAYAPISSVADFPRCPWM
jgi:hypothetical protein